MTKYAKFVLGFLLPALAGLAAALPAPPALAYPAHFPPPVYDFTADSLTAEKIQLGRHLFYDEILSADGTVSCANCHSPYNAFVHTEPLFTNQSFASNGLNVDTTLNDFGRMMITSLPAYRLALRLLAIG